MIRVWFNHWFSTAYRLIELIKKDATEEIYVIGTNKQYNSVIRLVCDEWYEEPDITGEEYIDYCVDFCKKHEINVFVPRKNMVDVSRNRDRFTEIGTRVLVDDYDKIEQLNDKVETYNIFKECEGIHVPEYYLVNTADELKEAYSKLKLSHDKICIKFVRDEGGMSFRRIIEARDRYDMLRFYPSASVVYHELIEILEEHGRFDDMMVMPFLPGDEISVDCLDTENGLIAIPRIKSSSRHEIIAYDDEIMRMSEIIMSRIQLECPCNIQFKIKDNIPYLLEINTRMSGGLQMTCLAADVNVPNIALNKILGKNIPWKQDKTQKTVSYIEIPQIIE